MIDNKIKQVERLVKLNDIAKKELGILMTDKNIIGINTLDNKDNILLTNDIIKNRLE
jgi:hypothetical protein